MLSTTAVLLRILLVGAVAVGVIVLGVHLARRFRGDIHASGPEPAAFTLEDLREMRRTGEISEQEFETVRSAMLEHVKEGLEEHPGES